MNTLHIRLLSLALFAVFCATLTYWIVTLTTRPAPPLQAAAVETKVPIEDAAALFGGQLTRDMSQNIKLFGVLALKNGAAAIIGINDEPARAIGLGSKITDSATLAEVRLRSILINRNGVNSEIFLPTNTASPTIYVR